MMVTPISTVVSTLRKAGFEWLCSQDPKPKVQYYERQMPYHPILFYINKLVWRLPYGRALNHQLETAESFPEIYFQLLHVTIVDATSHLRGALF